MVRHRFRSTSPVHSVMIQQRNSKRFLQINVPGIHIQESTIQRVEAFEKRMTKLEGGVGSVACASGMAALTMALMNILRSGDHVVAAAGLYGGTVELLDELKAYGITTTYVRENTPQAFEAEITPADQSCFCRNDRKSETGCHGHSGGGRNCT